MAPVSTNAFSCRELIFMVMSDELMSYFNLYRKSPVLDFNNRISK